MASELSAPSLRMPGASAWRRYAGDAILFARLVVAAAILLASRHGTHYVHHIAFVAGLAVVTWPVRGIRWSSIYDFFVAGVVGAYVIAGLQWLIEVTILHRSFATFRSAVIAPLTEEPLKLAPVVVLILLFGWRARWWSGAADIAACGVALGSGFGFVEDSFRRASQYPSSGGPRLLGIPLIPDAYNGFIGHGGSTGLIALAFGWWLWASRSKKWRGLALVPIVLGGYWMLLDHGLANYRNYSMDRFSRFIWRLDGNGMSAPYAFAILIIATIAAEWIALSMFAPKIRRHPIAAVARYIQAPLARGFGYPELRRVVTRWRGVLLYYLAHRQIRYVLLHGHGDAPIDKRRYAIAASETGTRLMVAHSAIAHP